MACSDWLYEAYTDYVKPSGLGSHAGIRYEWFCEAAIQRRESPFLFLVMVILVFPFPPISSFPSHPLVASFYISNAQASMLPRRRPHPTFQPLFTQQQCDEYINRRAHAPYPPYPIPAGEPGFSPSEGPGSYRVCAFGHWCHSGPRGRPLFAQVPFQCDPVERIHRFPVPGVPIPDWNPYFSPAALPRPHLTPERLAWGRAQLVALERARLLAIAELR